MAVIPERTPERSPEWGDQRTHAVTGRRVHRERVEARCHGLGKAAVPVLLVSPPLGGALGLYRIDDICERLGCGNISSVCATTLR